MLFAMAIPFFVYFFIVKNYLVNIPTYDDYGSLLDFVNRTTLEKSLMQQFWLMAEPENGHIPFLPRLLLLGQYFFLGSANFYWALIISNAGWLLSTALLVTFCARQYHIPFLYLIPAPFFMLSINHWEAIDFLSSALQMYWGSGLLAVAGIMLLTCDKIASASLLFAAAIFASGGALAVYPIACLYFLIERKWKDWLIFIFCSSVILVGYTFVNPPSQQVKSLPDLLTWINYTLEFTGNVIGSKQWDLSPLAWAHNLIGLFEIAAVLLLAWRTRGHIAIKLVFFYAVLLGVMAGYARIDLFAHAVSRYAMYAMLAASCAYILLVANYLGDINRPTFKLATICIVGTIGVSLWVNSLWACTTPLQLNHDQRIDGMRHLIETGSPEKLSAWNITRAMEILNATRESGVYDYRNSLP